VLVPLAPAATVTARLPAFAKIARRLDVEALTLEGELAAMAEQVLAKTSSRKRARRHERVRPHGRQLPMDRRPHRPG